jgi:Xaa-Pro aminopeptidase
MVFTIEPAFRVREEQINIRNEDLVVVVERGVEILYDFEHLTVDQIEMLMKVDDKLQSYPTAKTDEK